MKCIPLADLQYVNALNQKTWGWQIGATTDREDDYQKFTVLAVDPFTKTWCTTDGATIQEAVEKFIEIIEV
jgi:hypothetical protein